MWKLTCLLCAGRPRHPAAARHDLTAMQEHLMDDHLIPQGYCGDREEARFLLQSQVNRPTPTGYVYSLVTGQEWLRADRCEAACPEALAGRSGVAAEA